MDQSNELLYQIALTMIPNVGSVTARTLVAYCGGAAAVFQSKKQALLKIPTVGPAMAEQILSADYLKQAEAEIAFMEAYEVKSVFFSDSNFPARLKNRHEAPAILFFKGSDMQLLDAPRTVGIVGTRKPSEHGKVICEEIIEGLKPYNVVVFSGLAYGIDVTAHRKSSLIGVPNIGVLGHGLNSIYPSTHRSVAVKMIENGGLLTEFYHQAGPDREHFPQRNRIISGLSDALIVIETATEGGSMISAECAERQGRELFAVPGRVKDSMSAGCNMLIKEGRAKLLESAQDIAEALRWEQNGAAKPIQTQLMLDLLPDEQAVVNAIRAQPEIAIDDLIQETGIRSGSMAATILGLEFKGIIRTRPGKRYILTT